MSDQWPVKNPLIDFHGRIRFQSRFTIRWELEDKNFLKIDIRAIYTSMSCLLRRVLAKPRLILDEMCRLYGKFVSYFRRVSCKTRLTFPRIIGPNVYFEKVFIFKFPSDCKPRLKSNFTMSESSQSIFYGSLIRPVPTCWADVIKHFTFH